MASLSSADLLQRIESRHRDLLEQLDHLNDQVLGALEEFGSDQRSSDSTAAPETS